MSLRAITKNDDEGVLIPIPQYPLYSALITMNKVRQINYYLEESKGWTVDMAQLKRTYDHEYSRGVVPKAMVIINPGNPTGQVMS